MQKKVVCDGLSLHKIANTKVMGWKKIMAQDDVQVKQRNNSLEMGILIADSSWLQKRGVSM